MRSGKRFRLTYANVVATLALFVALGGTSYAALSITGKDIKNGSLTGKDVKNKSLAAADFKAGQLPAGPTGAAGPQGPAGAPGAALGYAHIFQSALDTAHSKGVVSITEGVFSSGEKDEDTICFDLDITPSNIIVSAEKGYNSSGNRSASHVDGVVPGPGTVGGGQAGCPASHNDALVTAYNSTSEEAPRGFYVLFN